MPLVSLWPVVCFFRCCVLAVSFSGFGLIKYIPPGLVLFCFAACAPCCTPVLTRSQPPHPSWLHLHPPCSWGLRDGTGKAAVLCAALHLGHLALPDVLPWLDLL